MTPTKITEAVFKTDIRFRTKADVSKRNVKVSEAFGICIDEEHEFVVYDNAAIEIRKGDIVYITGESGSGKSLLLKNIIHTINEDEDARKEFGKIITDNDVIASIDKRSIIEQIGKDTTDALRIFSIVGLNEAYLMLRKYDELSEGQKYRFRLAKMIDSNADTWIMDEFLALLDRVTARVVAYTIQKAARRFGKTLIVATSHTDLDEDLNPDLRITKHFGSLMNVERRVVQDKGSSLLKEVKIEKGSILDYNLVKDLHYRGSKVIPKLIYKATIDNELAGIIVYGPPHLLLKARSVTLPQYRKGKKSMRVVAEQVNKDIIRIWRVIVRPKFRGAGIATKLVHDTLPLTGYPYVESLAVMAKYSSFMEEAGMRKIEERLYTNHDKGYERSLQRLVSLGFDLEMLSSKRYCISILKSLPKDTLNEVRDLIIKHFFAEKFRHTTVLKDLQKGDIDAMAEALRNKRLPYVYLIWKNPSSNKPDPL